MIYIASDHGGFSLKGQIIKYLNSKNIDLKDLGPYEYKEDDDYPDYVIPLAKEVQKDIKSRGIVICRNGVGVSIAANKFKNIRTVLSWSPKQAESSKLDDDTNVLALPADYIDANTALEIVNTWLNTDFSGFPRHIRRIKKVESIQS